MISSPLSACLVFVAISLLLVDAHDDIGYDYLFSDSTNETTWDCWAAPGLPLWVNGSYIIPTVGQFSYGGREFKGVLDGYGKMNRFQMVGGQLCFRSKMMRTGFYNASRAEGTVSAGMLFDETVPPRACPKSAPKYPSCNIQAPNDNTFVNLIRLGDEYTTWTDSTNVDSFDPLTLDVKGKFNWTDKIGHKAHLGVLGSAHPLRRDAGRGDLVALQIDVPWGPEWLPGELGGGYANIVTINDKAPHDRQLLSTAKKQPITPYFHSYGVTTNFVVLGFTPMRYNIFPGILGKPMIDCFTQPSPLQTFFHLVPFNGSKTIVMNAPKAFTYNHVVNCYENATGVVFVATTWQNAALWLVKAGAQVDFQRNKTQRDDAAGLEQKQQIFRYHLHLYGEQAGQVTSEPISVTGRITDFPKVNMEYSTLPFCIYYAVESFHNDVEYASQAIVKHNMCTGDRAYWVKSSWFPSEPFFVPRVKGVHAGGEDDGVVTFTATDGVHGKSYFIVLNATDFKETLVQQELPQRITFATHGEWFDGLISEALH